MKAIASNGVEINTGDPVLIRDASNEDWRYTYFSHKVNTSDWPYVSSYTGSIQCIPYKGNEHLVGTNKDYRSYKEKQKQWIKENNIEVVEEVKTESTEKTNTATIVLMVVLVVIGGAGLLYLVSKSSK